MRKKYDFGIILWSLFPDIFSKSANLLTAGFHQNPWKFNENPVKNHQFSKWDISATTEPILKILGALKSCIFSLSNKLISEEFWESLKNPWIWKEISIPRHTGINMFKTRPSSKVEKSKKKTFEKDVFVTAQHGKLKKVFFENYEFFIFLKGAEWC